VVPKSEIIFKENSLQEFFFRTRHASNKIAIFETESTLKLLLLWSAKQTLLLSLRGNLFEILFFFSCCQFLSFSLHSQSQHLQSYHQRQH